MTRNRFWELLAKVKSGEASPEEQLELNQHLANFAYDIDLVKQIDEFWELPLPAKDTPSSDEVTNAWNKFSPKIIGEKASAQQPVIGSNVARITKRIISIAAILLFATGGIWLWKTLQVQAPVQKNIVSTKNGSRSKIEMPDGTQVWLNVGSRIEYDRNYGKENRELTLTGEAYFDVVHDENKPFIIHTPKMNVKVLGTVFNVKAYAEDEITEAALIKGSIEVTFPGRPQEKLILKPNDKISIINNRIYIDKDTLRGNQPDHKEKPEIALSKLSYQPADSTIIETAWVKNKFIFRSKTFDELSKEMGRWFNVTFVVYDSTLLDQKFTGTFGHETITEALDALNLSIPFRYKFDKNNSTVTILKK